MLELLELTRGVRVLEIGAGTGYNAALLAELVGDQRLVTTVDVTDPSGIRWWRDETLADDLDRYHAEWLAMGRPTLGDYRVAFVPIGEGRPPPHGLGAGPPLVPRTPLARGALTCISRRLPSRKRPAFAMNRQQAR